MSDLKDEKEWAAGLKTAFVGYLRVSTNQQDVEHQKSEILEYCRHHNLAINNSNFQWIASDLSSRKSAAERKIDKLLLNLASHGTLITTEISRLGRSTSEVLALVEKLLKNGYRVIFTKKNLDLKGQNDMTSKIILTIFSMLAELERDLISLRTKEALASKKRSGMVLGKPKGTLQKSLYDPHRAVIIECLQKGLDIANISRFLAVGKPRSLQDYVNSRQLKKNRMQT